MLNISKISVLNRNSINMLGDKKFRYAVGSILLAGSLFYLTDKVNTDVELFYSLVVFSILGLTGLIGSQFSQYIRISSLFAAILPLHLALGYLITSYYFPNLGTGIKLLSLIGMSFIIYVLMLLNNIFVVIEEKGSLIPLYNAAVTWVQILIISIAIPFISGIYKIPANFLIQNLVVTFSCFLFCIYMIWCMSFDPDIKKTSLSEKFTLLALLSTLVFYLGLSVSFFPTESFLRATFIASILLFNINYIYGHYKNRINHKLFVESGIIALIFFVILLIFQP